MKKANNDFEALVRVLGITKKRFGEITGVKGSTISKYLSNPTELRLKHISLFCQEEDVARMGLGEEEVINIIKGNDR